MNSWRVKKEISCPEAQPIFDNHGILIKEEDFFKHLTWFLMEL